MTYRVELTGRVEDAIYENACYIARDSASAAMKWLDRLYRRIASLNRLPRRFSLAPEDSYRSYEIRRMVFGDFRVLYTVDDAAATVWVIGFRRGQQLPRTDELPDSTPGL